MPEVQHSIELDSSTDCFRPNASGIFFRGIRNGGRESQKRSCVVDRADVAPTLTVNEPCENCSTTFAAGSALQELAELLLVAVLVALQTSPPSRSCLYHRQEAEEHAPTSIKWLAFRAPRSSKI